MGTQATATQFPATGPTGDVPQFKTNPYLGIAGVFCGAGIATLNSRLVSVGLPDLRGALGLGFDEASWIPTALNMATIFSGVFICFLSVLYGPRRILLPAAAVFALASAVLPFASGYTALMVLVTIAGLSSGTFYSLTMTFVVSALPKKLIVFGIAAYAADIVFVSNIASLLEGWFVDALSWRWIFWTAAMLTPLMMIFVYFGIPRRAPEGARPNWRGFAYFSAGVALLYGAMDQGERLDWLRSGIITGMAVAGIFLILAAVVRRVVQPNQVVNLSFLNRRNTIILSLSIFFFKFSHLATIVLIPNFLGNVAGYKPLQTGAALAWVAIPMFAVVWLVALLVLHANSRATLVLGFAVAALASWRLAHLDASWAGTSFETVELVLAAGFACTYIGLVANIVLEGLEAGALTSAVNAATFSGLMHFIRLFGGQVGVAFMTRVLTVRERFHSNLLGLHVSAGNWITNERLQALAAGMFPKSAGADEAQMRAIGILSAQVRAQAYTMATSDGFILVAWMVILFLLLMALLHRPRFSFQDLRRM
jgi:MFS transporter, DHA2 family, multidrug resistance protein